MRTAAQRILTAFALLVPAWITGCAIFPATEVNSAHPAVFQDGDQPHARVYFIRPRTERPMGEADNALTISVNQQPLLTLIKGEYTLVNMKPGPAHITVSTTTAMNLKADRLRQRRHSEEFTFSAHKTYYIVMQMINGEFRGIYHVPEQVAPMRARRIIEHLRPIGAAADEPINPV